MREEYVEAVLDLVEQVPSGRATTYGALAAWLQPTYGGGPRQVGQVMALHGGSVPWWRVIRADGSPPTCHERSALVRYEAEGTPLVSTGDEPRVDLRRAGWWPEDSASQ